MLDVLNIVRGGVAGKTFLPILTTFHIYNGRIQAMDGRVAIDAACEELKGVEATVDAERFMRAVEACEGEPKLEIDGGKLVVKRGRFRSRIALADSSQFPRHEEEVEGVNVKVPLGFLSTLKRLHAFVSEDASRPWSLGVLLHDGYAYATNNVVLARERVPIEAPDCIIPVFVLDEIMRIDAEPRSILITEKAVQVHFGTWWIRGQLIQGQWPAVAEMCKAIPKKMAALPEGFADAVRKVSAFVPDVKFPVITLRDDVVTTDDGAYFAEVSGMTFKAAASFRAEPLALIIDEATHMALSPHGEGKPCPWRGPHLEGLIAGVKR